MRKKSVSINEVKDSVESLKGKLLDIRINKGRKKIVKCVGEVMDVYPSVFTMRLDDAEGSIMSCSYSDLICGTVMINDRVGK